MDFILLIVFSWMQYAFCDFACDEYMRRSYQNYEEIETMFTIINYSFPADRVISNIYRNISCPCSNERLCIRKCCLPEDSFVGKTKTCQPSTEEHRFDVRNLPENLPESYTVIVGSFCPSSIKSTIGFRILENSSVYIEEDLVNVDEYCMDYFEDEEKIMILRCTDIVFVLTTVNFFYTFCLVVSEFFLLITLIVYASIGSLRSLPGKILISYVTSLLMSDGFTIMIQIFLIYEGTFCIFSALIVQFSFLASFFWLHIMCFDLWWTFSGFRSFNGSPKERDAKKFLVYCLYAWGCPSLIVAVTIYVEYDGPGAEAFLKPEFGKMNCWFSTKEAIFLYCYSFISIIVFSNLCMFISTTFTLKKHKKETKVFKRSGSRRYIGSTDDDNRQRFSLYLKLFIIMGVNWIMEVISFFFSELKTLWAVTDIGNTLQGVLIFYIFVCKPRVLVLLNEKMCPCLMMFKDTTTNLSPSSTTASSVRFSKTNGGNKFQLNTISITQLPNSN